MDVESNRTVTSSTELVKEGLKYFQILLEAYEEMDEEPSSGTIVGFLSGYESGLIALGLSEKRATIVTESISDIIYALIDEGCGECDECKKKKKNK